MSLYIKTMAVVTVTVNSIGFGVFIYMINKI